MRTFHINRKKAIARAQFVNIQSSFIRGKQKMKVGFAFWIRSTVLAFVLLAPLPSSATAPLGTKQGAEWTAAAQKDFYSRDQGSRIMPLRWIASLKQPNGEPFMASSLSRYGYLPNEESRPAGLPVGFTVGSGSNGQEIGMTCAACHTRQIEVKGLSYRIDGGPAIVDFQSFLADLDTAVNTVLTDQQAFTDFANAVLGPEPTLDDKTKLRVELEVWYLPYHTLMKGSLQSPAWGPARLDAVSMIFNRLTGLDIGPAPSYMIPENIRPAVAPVRYPFLWNAAIQDKTQWPGFSSNGNDILGLARNLGEVYGVFGTFHPKKDWSVLGIDYLHKNSADFQGLETLENLVRKIGPPKWPWKINQALANKGKVIFARKAEQGGCAECHGKKPGQTRFLNQKTWATPVMDVGTDSREYDVLGWAVSTGVLEGAEIFGITKPLKSTDTAFNVLKTAVLGSILQHSVPVLKKAEDQAQVKGAQSLFTPGTESLKKAFIVPSPGAQPSYAYESRVLEGIWAAAPYLHNGSVPTLAELLKPAAERVSSFKVGPAYDIVNVGLAVDQTRFDYTLQTTDCSDRNSGNSRCGHEFGTTLSPDEKKALLEYLKTL
jgi:mono/diheme cytochrome c family protein